MTFNPEEWRAGMQRNHGPEYRDKLREWGRKGGRIKTDKGTAKMTPEKVREISQKGVDARRAKK